LEGNQGRQSGRDGTGGIEGCIIGVRLHVSLHTRPQLGEYGLVVEVQLFDSCERDLSINLGKFCVSDHCGGWISGTGRPKFVKLTSLRENDMTSLRVCVDYDDPLVAELIQNALSQYIPDLKHTSPSEAELQWSSYESISFEKIMADPKNLCNSYIFRKALIRKHFLVNTVQNWLSKHPESVLATSVPRTHILECDYADYLDEALNESFELRDALEANGELESEERTYFILKPSMSDRGQGIRIFSTLEQLQEIFEQFEEEEASEEEEEAKEGTNIIASQLRYFVIQEYIKSPLLLDTIHQGQKFHFRVYVVAFGAIKVYVWSEILALFAAESYTSPSVSCEDMAGHLTNTCLQDGSRKDESVMRFWSLPLPQEVSHQMFDEICQITGEVFLAAAAGQQMHFQVVQYITVLTK